MSDELFTAAETRHIRPLPTYHARCDTCKLYKSGCKSPKLGVQGEGRAGILIVGPPPGAEDDEDGTYLATRGGEYLRSELSRLDFDPFVDGWVTGATICHDFNKDKPTTAVTDCRPNLLRAIRDLNPTVIILVGYDAVKSLIGHLWKPDVGSTVSRWANRHIPVHKPNAWVVPFNDLEYLTRDKPDVVAQMQFREALTEAFAKKGRPWPQGAPDYASRVECVFSPKEAAKRLKRYRGGLVAVDVETDRLKPDSRDARIVSCSVCWDGVETISFPWHGDVIPEMRRILLDPDIGKIASNLDMESRWFRAKIGIEVRNWKWDTMLAAHVADARRGSSGFDEEERGSGCTGLKFQAFVRLGVGDYSGHLEDYLRPVAGGEGGNAPNRVDDIPLKDLLLYGGLDSLLEYEIAQLQMSEAGV